MSASPATFSAHWLAMRERFDSAARDSAWPLLSVALREGVRSIRRVVDLGCGTGANRRYLGARLAALGAPADLEWLLVDADQRLLGVAARRIRIEADRGRRGAPPRVSFACADLADPAQWPALSAGDLVSASALVDLVSRSWLSDLVARCRAAGAAVHLALTYDGRSRWRPSHEHDGAVVAAFNRDQRADKGFGDALGPDAAPAAVALLESAGYRVAVARSDWRLDTRRRAARRLVAPLLEDHARIARQADPMQAQPVEGWLETRRRQSARGRLGVTIGHIDLMALPRG